MRRRELILRVAVRANWKQVFICLTVFLADPVGAQEAPNLSPSCRAPLSGTTGPEFLPRLAASLERRKSVHIVAIGSSSTVGVGASSPKQNYPTQIEPILERAFKGRDVFVDNSGVSGELAAATAHRLKTEVALKQPDLVLWQVGTNDALAGVPIEEFRSTLTSTLWWLKEHNIEVVLIGLQYSPRVARDARHKAVEQVLREIASTENVLLVRRYELMEFLANAKREEVLSSDGLHQSDLGYRCMAEHIARAVSVGVFRVRSRGKQSESR